MKHKFIVLITALVVLTSCKKFLDVGSPSNQILTSSVFQDESTARAALIGIYSRMTFNSNFIFGQQNLTSICGLTADEFDNYSSDINVVQVSTNSLVSTNLVVSSFWTIPYQYIYTANAIIEGLTNNETIEISTKNQLLGEAYFIRSFCYFYLINLYGDVPYHTSTNFVINNTTRKSPKSAIYQQLIANLIKAKGLLSNNYSFSVDERTRPNRYVAGALLSRIYLYLEKWAEAETEASEILSASNLYNLEEVNLNEVFLKNNREAIWQLSPIEPGYNTDEGRYLILTTTPIFVALSDEVYNAFEPNDPRKTNWVGSVTVGGSTYRYPYKYKIRTGTLVTEYFTVFRLAEQYLIRAEARAHQDNIFASVSDLNIVRKRARGNSNLALPDFDSRISVNELLQAIYKERRIEFFAELGHRWFDLKRINETNKVLSPIKGPNWSIHDNVFPIPENEILNNLNITQNEGYN